MNREREEGDSKSSSPTHGPPSPNNQDQQSAAPEPKDEPTAVPNSSGTSNPRPSNETSPPSPTRPTVGYSGLDFPMREGSYLSQFYSQPIVTTLTGFSQVANLVRNPYELINNVDEFVRQRKMQRTSENFIRTLNQANQSPVPPTAVAKELDTFVASTNPNRSTLSLDNAENSSSPPATDRYSDRKNIKENQPPIPALPPIECSEKRGREPPLTIEEYESRFRKDATDLELIERVFSGSVSCNQLRAALWPYLFGIIKHRGKFERLLSADGQTAWLFVEHEANTSTWRELRELYETYSSQWRAILPDQELRFSTFRERKSLIERDVIRCDRLHPFYAEKPENLAALTDLLMAYMMYDFDIGYVQGMSDLAGPILYMYNGNPIKAFWTFVEVMKLFRRNFELTQRTIHFQLACLYELIKQTDPIFAQYLDENESSNCFFAFRAIVCQFKRELMKEDEDDYSKVLFLWDTIWCVKRRRTIQEELEALGNDVDMPPQQPGLPGPSHSTPTKSTAEQPPNQEDLLFPMHDSNQADTLRRNLSETEVFVLALCLSMIRRERDIIMANRLDGTYIHLHFVDPKLASDVNGFIEHAINVYLYMKSDKFDIKSLSTPKTIKPPEAEPKEPVAESPPESSEGYDLLNDFMIINGASS